MDRLERSAAETLQLHGWKTEFHEENTVAGLETDIVAYNPVSHKMFYGNLTDITHHDELHWILEEADS